MHNRGLFWKVLLPAAAAVAAAALVMSTGVFNTPVRVLLLLILLCAVAIHALWVSRQVSRREAVIAGAIGRWQAALAGEDRFAPPTVGAAPVPRTIADLQRWIDDLRRHQTELSNTSALLESVLDTMVEGVVVLDCHQRILFTNSASRPLLNLPGSSIEGRPLWELSRLPAVNRAVENVSAGQQREVLEFAIPRTRLVVAATITPLPREPVPGVMLVLHDVTELRRLENLRREFVSNVSHELKTPLTSIQAYADTLLENDLRDLEQVRMFLQRIVEQSERLGALILDIIRLGKIESEPEAMEIRPVRVEPIVQACLEAHATIADTKQIALSAGPVCADAVVGADPGELRTILDNLVDNALQYTAAGGAVSIRVVDSPDGGHHVGIEVSDTGIGMARDQQQRIFERFYRVDRARDRQRGGTGLGLAIVKHLCQMFGGRVDVQSELGVGSTFTVWLPQAVADAPADTSGPPLPAPPENGPSPTGPAGLPEATPHVAGGAVRG